MSERNTENVVGLLRPLLKELGVQRITANPTVVKASKYRELIVAEMGRCIIVARQTALSEDTKGCLSFSYDKSHEIFLFVINVEQSLFANESEKLRIARKAIAVHEFVHCVSAMLLLSRLRTEPFIQRTERSMSQRVALTTSSGFNDLLMALRQIGIKGNGSKPELLADEHFRIGNEDEFVGHYGDLYINFLLSYQLLRETTVAAKIQCGNPSISFLELLPIVHKDLVEKKALEREFVLGRIRTFLPNMFEEFA